MPPWIREVVEHLFLDALGPSLEQHRHQLEALRLRHRVTGRGEMQSHRCHPCVAVLVLHAVKSLHILLGREQLASQLEFLPHLGGDRRRIAPIVDVHKSAQDPEQALLHHVRQHWRNTRRRGARHVEHARQLLDDSCEVGQRERVRQVRRLDERLDELTLTHSGEQLRPPKVLDADGHAVYEQKVHKLGPSLSERFAVRRHGARFALAHRLHRLRAEHEILVPKRCEAAGSHSLPFCRDVLLRAKLGNGVNNVVEQLGVRRRKRQGVKVQV
mmetsp:Transcript_8377/g.27838  ORF Transcript_8377/g.27838 Transcript_8377/m.27838 type:complete len:271 (+) Transcript_8377:1265-2077(+)